MMGEKFQRPVMFPCASGVKMPQVGADESEIKSKRVQIPAFTLSATPASFRGRTAFHDEVVKGVTTNLTFSEDVVRERCFHMLQYDNKYLSEALDVSDIIPSVSSPKKNFLIGRYNTRGSDKRHMPCHIKSRGTTRLKPMKKKMMEKAMQMHQEALTAGGESSRTSTPESRYEEQKETEPSVFITEGETIDTEMKHRKSTREWDEYLVTLLSKNTAQWIVNQQLTPGEPKQSKLQDVLHTYHGEVTKSTELLPDTVSESEFPILDDQPKDSHYQKPGETLLDRVRSIEMKAGKETDPYGDDTDAAFYRLPAGFRRAKKHLDKEEAGAINQTAYKIEVHPYVAKPLPTLKDWINPAVGNKFHSTDNLYEQEWLTGGKQLHQKTEADGTIVMASRNKYQKVLQGESPKRPQHWYTEDEQKEVSNRQLNRGLHRWQQLPQLIDETSMPKDDVAAGIKPELQKSSDVNKQAQNNTVLTMIVDDWRSKWHLDMRYADASPEDLIRDMADLHPNIRLKAITTCARAAEYRPPQQAGIDLQGSLNPSDRLRLLPEKLFVALQCCLDDKHEKVRMAAAIALFTLERPCAQADKILRATLKQQKSVDRWTAAQCLAYYGECDSEVVGELVHQLLNSEDKIRHEQAAYLLGRLSENSTLVHCMLGEQLNSSSWRHRVMVCRTFPKLYGHINKDLVNKLTHLMWHDWHQEVRKAAAQCLGKTGHGKEVHDELMHKMLSHTERIRVEAISKVGHLGFMTAKILPVFLKCFDDTFVSVRTEVCLACSNLVIQDDQIVQKLVHLATYDPIWKVKALAIQALGNIHKVNKNVRSCILWALRYEDQEGIRAEACHTAMKLGFKDQEVVVMLQERLLTENSPTVRKEIMDALEQMGISPTDDMDMVAQIKDEVRKLGSCKNIAAQITMNEKEADKKTNIKRMIAPPKEKSKQQEIPKSRPVSHVSSQRGSHVNPFDSRLTPVADLEVTAITQGKDTPSTLSEFQTEHGTSPQKSAKTVTTEATEENLSQLDEDEYDDETVTVTSHLQPEEETTKERTLCEKHLYVEVTDDRHSKKNSMDEHKISAEVNLKDPSPLPLYRQESSDIVDVLDFGPLAGVEMLKTMPKIEIVNANGSEKNEQCSVEQVTESENCNVENISQNNSGSEVIDQDLYDTETTQMEICSSTPGEDQLVDEDNKGVEEDSIKNLPESQEIDSVEECQNNTDSKETNKELYDSENNGKQTFSDTTEGDNLSDKVKEMDENGTSL